jgi:hypothetical protein
MLTQKYLKVYTEFPLNKGKYTLEVLNVESFPNIGSVGISKSILKVSIG